MRRRDDAQKGAAIGQHDIHFSITSDNVIVRDDDAVGSPDDTCAVAAIAVEQHDGIAHPAVDGLQLIIELREQSSG
jgi:hypothetical protein